VDSPEALTRGYLDLWRKVWALKDDAGLSAAVYTQWTDVEAECNGLLTYDRKVVKVDAKQVAEAHRGKIALPKTEGRKQKADGRGEEATLNCGTVSRSPDRRGCKPVSARPAQP
jgi:hypothetical protein